MPVVMELGQFCHRELMGGSWLLLTQFESCPELKESIVLHGERCWLLCGQLDILDPIYMAGNSLLAQITTHFVGFTTLRSQKDRLLVGWKFYPNLTIGWSTALECSMLMQIHSLEGSVGSVVNLQTPVLKGML